MVVISGTYKNYVKKIMMRLRIMIDMHVDERVINNISVEI